MKTTLTGWLYYFDLLVGKLMLRVSACVLHYKVSESFQNCKLLLNKDLLS
jgi:hypothetical protein